MLRPGRGTGRVTRTQGKEEKGRGGNGRAETRAGETPEA